MIYGAHQVEAALFATGCLSELSTNYAQIAFEKVVDMANAMGSSPAIKLAAIRVFSKFGVSPHLSLEAQEVCSIPINNSHSSGKNVLVWMIGHSSW